MSWPWGGKNGSTCVNAAQQTRPHIHVFQNTLYYWFLCLTDTAAAFQPQAEHAPTTTNISPRPSASPSGGDVLAAACPTAIMNFGGRPHGQGRQWSRSEGRPRRRSSRSHDLRLPGSLTGGRHAGPLLAPTSGSGWAGTLRPRTLARLSSSGEQEQIQADGETGEAWFRMPLRCVRLPGSRAADHGLPYRVMQEMA